MNEEIEYEPSEEEIKEIEDYWMDLCTASHKDWYNEITPIEAVRIRDHMDDEIFKEYGIVAHSPILDLRYDNYGLLTMEAQVPEYKELIKEQKDWGLYKGGRKDTTE